MAIAVYLLIQVIPPYFNNYQFQDSIEEVARFSGVDARATEDDIRLKAYKAAQDYNIPVTAEQINVRRNGTEIAIWADYSVHLNIPVRPMDLDFHPATKAKPIL